MARLSSGGISEVIIGTNPTVEGETTAMYLKRLITPLGLRVTRLARGLPFGSELEYADDVTLQPRHRRPPGVLILKQYPFGSPDTGIYYDST